MNEKPSADVPSQPRVAAESPTESAASAPKPAVRAATPRASGRCWFVFDRWLPMAGGPDEDEFVLA